MKNKIPQFLQNKLSLQIPKVKNFPQDIQKFIIEYGEYYEFDYDNDITRIFKLMKQGISEIPECELENCNNKKMIKKFEAQLSRGCCSQHAQELTMIERFGISNLFKNPETSKNGLMKKYGVTHNTQIKKVKDKMKKTLIEKYGVSNPSQSEEIKEKKKKTLLKNFGVEHNSQIDIVKKKKKEKSLEKYGVEFVLQAEEIKNKARETRLHKYGVEHHLQNPEIYKKTKKTNLEKYGIEFPILRFSSYSHKPFIWETGEISMVQGYEPKVLKELEEEGYSFNDIKTSPKDMPEIKYTLNGKEHRYYPDIFIPKENIIIEVKSEYTLHKEWDKNQAKFEATRDLGFDFKLEVR